MAAVLVHIDLDGNRPHPSSLVALAAGRQIASSWGATLYAAVLAHDPSERAAPDSTGQVLNAPTALAGEQIAGLGSIEDVLARAGADKVVVAITDAPVAPLWAAVGGAWQGVLDHLRPRLVLFGADSPSAPELAARSGARIGARLLGRARAVGIDDVELRDRDGGYVRGSDGGAAVAIVGGADVVPGGDDDIDLLVLALAGGTDARVELAGTSPAEPLQAAGVLVAIGDDAAGDPEVATGARKLAALLGAQLVGGPAAARAGLVPPAAVVDAAPPLAPALCIAIGTPALELAGAARVIQLGAPAGKHADGALPGRAGAVLAELVARLEARR